MIVKKAFPYVLVLAVVFILAQAVGCQKPETREIQIGAVLPLTGDIASYGKRAQNGINLALAEINRSGTNPFRIAVEFQDGKGSAQESVTIMRKFCSLDHYPVVIGAAASSVSLAIAPIANQYRVVQISPISSSPDLTKEGGDYFFRVCPSDAFQAAILADWIWKKELKRVGILFVNNSWGISLKNRFVSEFTALGGQITTVESCMEGDRDFRTQLAKIVASSPEAFYCPTYGTEGGLVLKQLKEIGFSGEIFGSDVWSSPELLTSAGDAAEGVYLVKPSDPSGEAYEVFATGFREKYNEDPDVYAGYAYDIMYILQRAIAAGNTTGPDVRSYLLSMPVFKGVTGETHFDENGDCNTKTFVRQRIMSGRYTAL